MLEASSGRFQGVPVYAGVGSGGKFRKVLERAVCGGVSSGTGSRRFRKV